MILRVGFGRLETDGVGFVPDDVEGAIEQAGSILGIAGDGMPRVRGEAERGRLSIVAHECQGNGHG